MSLARLEGPLSFNGVIASPGNVVTNFGGYVRQAGVRYVRLDWLYVQAAANTAMQLVLVNALADVGAQAYLLVNYSATGTVPQGVSAFRPCQPVMLNLTSRIPYSLVIRNKTVATNLDIFLAWSDVEAP